MKRESAPRGVALRIPQGRPLSGCRRGVSRVRDGRWQADRC
jgi:hypothetical protein